MARSSGSKRSAWQPLRRSFSSDLSFKDRPLITEAQVSIQFGEGQDLLKGVGIVGGAETSIRYTDSPDNPATLTMTSDNGGGTLKGLGITDTIRSGEMVLKTRFRDGYSNFDTNIRLTNFRVVEAPRAVRAFSVLGPAGLVGLLEGEGTFFGWGRSADRNPGSLVRMTQVAGQGQSVSVAFVGEYDRETRIMDVSGNLVPASFISQLIGVIPIVGQILTGVDKAGLFVTQFSLTGDVDDPDKSVTPASVFRACCAMCSSRHGLSARATAFWGHQRMADQPVNIQVMTIGALTFCQLKSWRGHRQNQAGRRT